jgi:hypothetical protein
LAESGLFNGLRRIQIKIFPLALKTRSGCKTAAQRPARRREHGTRFNQVRHQG